MRTATKPAFKLYQIPIQEVDLDLESRHELTPILAGLQHLYRQKKTLREILALIEDDVLGKGKDKRRRTRGAPGMEYWEILVLAAVRLGCNADYDDLHDKANSPYGE